MQGINLNNKPAIEYYEGIYPVIREITDPLYKNFRLVFAYHKLYEDGRYLLLIDRPEFQKWYYFNIHSYNDKVVENYQSSSPNGETKVFICSSDIPSDRYHQNIYDFNLWYGVWLLKKGKDFYEEWSFVSDPEHPQATSFCLKNIPLLKKFIGYFNLKMQDFIIDPVFATMRDGTGLEKNLSNLHTNDSVNNFSQYLDKELLKDPQIRVFNSLSKQQKACLDLLIQGKTIKEVGNCLNLSPRTVEVYLKNVRDKVDIGFKSSLIEAYRNYLKTQGHLWV